MNTTNLFVELLVIGIGGASWFCLVVASIFGTPLIQIEKLSSSLWVVPALSFIYLCGVIVDRVADRIFETFDTRVCAKYYCQCAGVPHLGVQDFYHDRNLIMNKSERFATLYEYGRSRQRIARGWAVNSGLLVVTLLFLLVEKIRLHENLYPFLVATIVLLLLGIMSTIAWFLLNKQQYQKVHFQAQFLRQLWPEQDTAKTPRRKIDSVSVQHAYGEWATTYDSDTNLTRDLDRQVMQTTLAGGRFDCVLEIGCGTGKNTALLASIAGSVQALDFSKEMIARAREKAAYDNVTFTVADITQPWPVADSSVDLISCNLVLEHVEDLAFIFSQAARVLQRRGQFLVNELHPFRQYQGTKARFTRENETIQIPAFTHHISDFLDAATANNLGLVEMKELWHAQDDRGNLPRLVSFMFVK